MRPRGGHEPRGRATHTMHVMEWSAVYVMEQLASERTRSHLELAEQLR
jgi:hypothetical protein